MGGQMERILVTAFILSDKLLDKVGKEYHREIREIMGKLGKLIFLMTASGELDPRTVRFFWKYVSKRCRGEVK